ncbi:PREDICTED: two-component response regulator-like APRR9 isoform X2 [Tarenaya hassleriana]|uniref:two-component response regulator-like APRR9 isoform X2 n=1 Tax=Tarenaya hassleriana TaxID=28532 RepID=UPI00053C577F|nr:PREDICTED: two-component response regulator-like APRR9 isoform X2 [Tarenaya hassleriana]
MVEVVVVSSDDGMEAEEGRKTIDGGGQSSGVVLWEKYMPKIVLRVLLVEADDSTRHVISDLLRKCNYRVSAVPDGLTAWETLKGRPQSIDLVLTELDLPLISGFALLTLVMEHETCKNIPVIMMSSQDSFGMVLKCLLKGAADYLIKPVRKNELRNLWQHVWRRHALSAPPVHHGLPASEPKLEATAENSTESRDYLTSTTCKNTNRKGFDVQSSCSSHGISRAKQADGGIPTMLRENAKSVKELATPLNQIEEKLAKAGTGGGNMLLGGRDGTADLGRHVVNSVWREKMSESSGMTMDLIGAFDEQPNCLNGVDCYTENVCPELELSLKRFSPRTSKDQYESERQMLCQSNNSAFSRYDNGKPVVVAAATSSSSEPKTSTESHEQFKMVSSDIQSVTTSSNNQENMGSCISGQYGQSDFSYLNQVLQANPQKDSPFSRETLVGSEETMKAGQELELGCQSCSTEKSKEEQSAAEDDGLRGTMEQQRWRQREAALSKFRMKRKDRCFEKRVRYQSRKKLAEQRPRVRGQFVRALNYEIPPPHVSDGP